MQFKKVMFTVTVNVNFPSANMQQFKLVKLLLFCYFLHFILSTIYCCIKIIKFSITAIIIQTFCMRSIDGAFKLVFNDFNHAWRVDAVYTDYGGRCRTRAFRHYDATWPKRFDALRCDRQRLISSEADDIHKLSPIVAVCQAPFLTGGLRRARRWGWGGVWFFKLKMTNFGAFWSRVFMSCDLGIVRRRLALYGLSRPPANALAGNLHVFSRLSFDSSALCQQLGLLYTGDLSSSVYAWRFGV